MIDLTSTMDTEPGCIDRVRSVGGGWKLRGGRQRDERVHDGVWSRHVDRMAEHVRPANTRWLIIIKLQRNWATILPVAVRNRRFLRWKTTTVADVTSKKKDPLFDFFLYLALLLVVDFNQLQKDAHYTDLCFKQVWQRREMFERSSFQKQ